MRASTDLHVTALVDVLQGIEKQIVEGATELMRIEEQGNMLVLIEGRDHVLPEHVEFLCEDARGQTVPFPDGEHR